MLITKASFNDRKKKKSNELVKILLPRSVLAKAPAVVVRINALLDHIDILHLPFDHQVLAIKGRLYESMALFHVHGDGVI